MNLEKAFKIIERYCPPTPSDDGKEFCDAVGFVRGVIDGLTVLAEPSKDFFCKHGVACIEECSLCRDEEI